MAQAPAENPDIAATVPAGGRAAAAADGGQDPGRPPCGRTSWRGSGGGQAAIRGAGGDPRRRDRGGDPGDARAPGRRSWSRKL